MGSTPILSLRPRLKVVESDIGKSTAERGAIHRKTDTVKPFSFGLVCRTSKNGPRGVGISGSASRVSGRCVRNASRGTRGSALARLRFRKPELQPATLLLLASRGHLKCTKTEASAKLLPMHPSLKHALLE